jgi:hypothetical protein
MSFSMLTEKEEGDKRLYSITGKMLAQRGKGQDSGEFLPPCLLR